MKNTLILKNIIYYYYFFVVSVKNQHRTWSEVGSFIRDIVYYLLNNLWNIQIKNVDNYIHQLGYIIHCFNIVLHDY